jgi:hypothetical protein
MNNNKTSITTNSSWSEEDLVTLLELKSEGKSNGEIANILKRSYGAVSQKIFQYRKEFGDEVFQTEEYTATPSTASSNGTPTSKNEAYGKTTLKINPGLPKNEGRRVKHYPHIPMDEAGFNTLKSSITKLGSFSHEYKDIMLNLLKYASKKVKKAGREDYFEELKEAKRILVGA